MPGSQRTLNHFDHVPFPSLKASLVLTAFFTVVGLNLLMPLEEGLSTTGLLTMLLRLM